MRTKNVLSAHHDHRHSTISCAFITAFRDVLTWPLVARTARRKAFAWGDARMRAGREVR